MISWGPPLSAINKNLTYKTNSRPGRGGGAIRKFLPWKIGHRVFGLQITGAHFQYYSCGFILICLDFIVANCHFILPVED
jgi:hypothetical protein